MTDMSKMAVLKTDHALSASSSSSSAAAAASAAVGAGSYKSRPPFPSFHTSQDVRESLFPSRWFEVPNHVPPTEPLKAPRIRLGPLSHKNRTDNAAALFVAAANSKNDAAVVITSPRANADASSTTGTGATGPATSTASAGAAGGVATMDSKSLAKSEEDKKKKKLTKREIIETEVRGLELMHTVNLAHQELGDSFQMPHLKAVLRRLSAVHTLVLNHNGLSDLSDIGLPQVETLYVSHNEFTSIAKLPRCPNLKVLNASHNFLKDISGIAKRFPVLESLVLRGNPIEKSTDYVAKVRKSCEKLKTLLFLDEIPLQNL
eukprot:ANDGO_06356.mRNA.1 AIR9 protein